MLNVFAYGVVVDGQICFSMLGSTSLGQVAGTAKGLSLEVGSPHKGLFPWDITLISVKNFKRSFPSVVNKIQLQI